MKRVIECISCHKLTKYYGSYKVKARRLVANPLTGETKEVEEMGRLCPTCNARIYSKKPRKGGEIKNAKSKA